MIQGIFHYEVRLIYHYLLYSVVFAYTFD
jgi:hypothetical protein